VIAVQNNADHAAKDEAFAQIGARYVRVTRTIPVCCGKAMLYSGPGGGRVRYYRCPNCKRTASGTKTTEIIP